MTDQAKTASQRKAEHRQRLKEQGLCEFIVTLPNTPDAKARARAYTEKMIKAHLKANA